MWLDYKEIGRRAKKIRGDLELSQGAMAERIGLNRGSGGRIGKLERGQLWGEDGQTPEPRMLESIAQAGGHDLEHFRDGEVSDLGLREKLAVLRWLNKTTAALQEEIATISPEGETRLADVLGKLPHRGSAGKAKKVRGP